MEMPCSECGYRLRFSAVLGRHRAPKWFMGRECGYFALLWRGPGMLWRFMVPFWPWRTLSLETLQRACGHRTMIAWFLWLALVFSFLPIFAFVAHESILVRYDIRWASNLMARNRIELQKARAKDIDLNGEYPFVDPEAKTAVLEVDDTAFVWTWVGRCSMTRFAMFLGYPPQDYSALAFPRLLQKDVPTIQSDRPLISVLRADYVPRVSMDEIILLRGIPFQSRRTWTPEGQWATRFNRGAPTRFLMIVPLVLGSTLLMPCCFLLLPFTLRRARVDKRQLVRLGSFSLAMLLPLGILEIYLGSSSFYGPVMTTIRGLWYVEFPTAAILLWAFLLWTWWWGACRLLRLPRAPLVAAVLLLVATLASELVLRLWLDLPFLLLGDRIAGS